MTERKITLVLGKRGSGKSYLARKLTDDCPRLVVYDTMREYDQGMIFEDFGEIARFWRANYRRNFRLVYRPTDHEGDFRQIANLCWLCGRLTFLVEEIDLFSNPHTIDPAFRNIINRGRHQEISLVGIVQRPFGIHRSLTSQAKEVYCFNTNEPRDREYLRGLLGSEIEAAVDGLEQYQYALWRDGSDKIEVGRA